MPEFTSDAEEREFWKTHDVREYINWKKAGTAIDHFFENKNNAEDFLSAFEKGLASKK